MALLFQITDCIKIGFLFLSTSLLTADGGGLGMYLDLKYVVLHQHIILWLLFKVSLFSACYYKVRTVSYMYLKLQAAQHI